MAILIRQVPAATVYPLRHAVLRPNQRFEDCAFPGDDDPDTAHFAACSGEAILGIASIYKHPPPAGESPDAWRLRGMATEQSLRGTGIGGQLLNACIAHMESRGGVLIWCNARTPAVKFYERFGFSCLGDEFELPGIGPHYLMMKRIKRTSDG
jgi:predicted GNAT family N-acyltransferase